MAERGGTVTERRGAFAQARRTRRRRRLRPYLVALLVVVLLVAGGWAVWSSSLLSARSVEVSGTRTLSPAEVRRVARVPLGIPLARVDLDVVRARVENLGMVRAAHVSRSWPHTVHLSVTERAPVAVVNRGSGLQAVDREGVLFGHYGRAPRGLPVVRTAPDVGTGTLAEAGRVAAALPPRLLRRVTFIAVGSVDRITVNLRSGVRVAWGDSSASAVKVRVVEVLLRRHPSRIDVSAPSRPTLTP